MLGHWLLLWKRLYFILEHLSTQWGLSLLKPCSLKPCILLFLFGSYYNRWAGASGLVYMTFQIYSTFKIQDKDPQSINILKIISYWWVLKQSIWSSRNQYLKTKMKQKNNKTFTLILTLKVSVEALWNVISPMPLLLFLPYIPLHTGWHSILL